MLFVQHLVSEIGAREKAYTVRSTLREFGGILQVRTFIPLPSFKFSALPLHFVLYRLWCFRTS